MDTATVLALVKEGLGIRTSARDTYLTARVEGELKELEDEKGLVLDSANPYHLMFAVDYVVWRYQSKGSNAGMPRHLQYRLHNLIIHVGTAMLRVSGVEIVAALPYAPTTSVVYILPDGSKQMYIDGVWALVDLVNGAWVVVAT